LLMFDSESGGWRFPFLVKLKCQEQLTLFCFAYWTLKPEVKKRKEAETLSWPVLTEVVMRELSPFFWIKRELSPFWLIFWCFTKKCSFRSHQLSVSYLTSPNPSPKPSTTLQMLSLLLLLFFLRSQMLSLLSFLFLPVCPLLHFQGSNR
jgi:hypothetical protein